MDVAFILDKYFKGKEGVSIDVFDAQTLNAVYQDVVNAMTSHLDIEISVLQALSYCLYEMMDNVHIHSGKPLGTAMTHYDPVQKVLRILIADDGMGIRASLAENEKFKDVTEPEALRLLVPGGHHNRWQGNGLWALHHITSGGQHRQGVYPAFRQP